MFCHDADNIQAPIKNFQRREIDSLLNNPVIIYHGDWGRCVENWKWLPEEPLQSTQHKAMTYWLHSAHL